MKPVNVGDFKDADIHAIVPCLQVLSCDPLRVFIYKEGLTRICTEKYIKPKGDNLSLTYMHLTNYAVRCLSFLLGPRPMGLHFK